MGMDLCLLLLYSFIIMDVVVVELCIGFGQSLPPIVYLVTGSSSFPWRKTSSMVLSVVLRAHELV